MSIVFACVKGTVEVVAVERHGPDKTVEVKDVLIKGETVTVGKGKKEDAWKRRKNRPRKTPNPRPTPLRPVRLLERLEETPNRKLHRHREPRRGV